MSDRYHYFTASLPILNFDSKPPMSVTDFLADCERLLTDRDWEDMSLALSESSRPDLVSNALLKEWIDFNRRFRNEMAWFRAIKVNKDPASYVRGDRYVDPVLVDAVVNASKASNPLEGEKILDRTRWQFLDDLQLGHYFDLEFLLIYGLKLKILERYEVFNSPKGGEILDKYLEMELPELERV